MKPPRERQWLVDESGHFTKHEGELLLNALEEIRCDLQDMRLAHDDSPLVKHLQPGYGIGIADAERYLQSLRRRILRSTVRG